jgi:hypothetical protein
MYLATNSDDRLAYVGTPKGVGQIERRDLRLFKMRPSWATFASSAFRRCFRERAPGLIC